LRINRKSWDVKEQMGPCVTSVDLVFIEESEEEEVVKEHFVEA
jgi:hypothetical protein